MKWTACLAAGLAIFAVACGNSAPQSSAAGDDEGVLVATAEAAPPAAELADAPPVEPTGKVITVKMITDAQGNYFEPAEVSVKRGDVIRFELASGVHNVSFPAGDNPGAKSLPGASPYLQTPGQTFDLTVDLAAGEYTFQCDPHAAMGMVGTLNVTE